MEFLFTDKWASFEALLVLICLAIILAIYAYDGYVFLQRFFSVFGKRKPILEMQATPIEPASDTTQWENIDSPEDKNTWVEEVINPTENITESNKDTQINDESTDTDATQWQESTTVSEDDIYKEYVALVDETHQEKMEEAQVDANETSEPVDQEVVAETISEEVAAERGPEVTTSSQEQQEKAEEIIDKKEDSIDFDHLWSEWDDRVAVEAEDTNKEVNIPTVSEFQENISPDIWMSPDIQSDIQDEVTGNWIESNQDTPEDKGEINELISIAEDTVPDQEWEQQGDKTSQWTWDLEWTEYLTEGLPEEIGAPEKESASQPREKTTTPNDIWKSESNEHEYSSESVPQKNHNETIFALVGNIKTLIARGQTTEARSLIIQWLALDKRHRELNLLLGSLYEAERHFEKAEYVYKDLALDHSDDIEILEKLWNVLIIERRYTIGLEIYKKILSIGGETEWTLYILSHLCHELGDASEWHIYMKKYLRSWPNNPEILALMSEAEIELGKRKDAIETLKRLKNLTPYNGEITATLQKLMMEEELAGNFGEQ